MRTLAIYGLCRAAKTDLDLTLQQDQVSERAVRSIFSKTASGYSTMATVAIAIGPSAMVASISAMHRHIFLFMLAGGMAIVMSLIFFRRMSEEVNRAEFIFDGKLSERYLERVQTAEGIVDFGKMGEAMTVARTPANQDIKQAADDVWEEVMALERRVWWRGCALFATGCALCVVALVFHFLGCHTSC